MYNIILCAVEHYNVLCMYIFQASVPLTLSDTPLQLFKDVGQQHLAEWLVEVREHITDGVQRVITCGRHPLRFLPDKHNVLSVKHSRKGCGVISQHTRIYSVV